MTIQEVYKIIDSPNFRILEDHDNQVTKLFKPLTEENNPDTNQDIIRFAQIEIDVQNFQINDNKLSPMMTGTNANGDYFEYPTLQNWINSDFEYIIKRQKITKNNELKIKYCHILWLSTKKHLDYAKITLKGYLKSIKNSNKTAWEKPNSREVFDLKRTIDNAFYLALSTSQASEVEKIKKIILAITRNFRYNSDKTHMNISLIRLMLSNPKIFKQADFKNLDKACLKFAEIQTSSHSKIEILGVGEKVSKRLGIKTIIWNEELAKLYEELSKQREDGTNLAALHFAQDALTYYKKLKNKSKIKELEDWYKHLKQTMKLGVISQDFDVTQIVKELKQLASEVVKKPTDHIIAFLIYSPLIFPSYQDLYNDTLKRKEENGFQFLFGTTLLDQFGYTSAHFTDEEEKIHLSIMQGFDFRIKLSSIFLLREIIFNSIKENKLSSFSILNFLRLHSWLGQDITITHVESEERVFNWLQTIAPGLNDFFSQVYFMYQNPLNVPNPILAIDSLSLKIEGILRDICGLRGVTTFFQTEDSKGRSIVKEKDINTLLREDVLKQTFSKDDMMLFQFLLIEKAGWNLRNKVAHTLIRSANDYDLGQMLLLIVVILKLSKNEYAPIPKTKQTKK